MPALPVSPEFTRVLTMVEKTICDLGVDPQATRVDTDSHVAYALRRGSARVLIAVHAADAELEGGRLRVVAPVVKSTGEHTPELYRWLLEANASVLVGAAFALSGDEIVVVAERPVRDLTQWEIDYTVRTIGRLADQYDDELAKAFATARASDG